MVFLSCGFEEIRERLGVQSEEEIEIEDYELPFPLEATQGSGNQRPLPDGTGNAGTPLYYEMDVVQKRWFPSFTEFIDHKDQIRCYPVQDGKALARYLVQEVQLFGEVHPDLLNHIDYAAIGRNWKIVNTTCLRTMVSLLPLKRRWRNLGGNADLHCQLRQNTMRANWSGHGSRHLWTLRKSRNVSA